MKQVDRLCAERTAINGMETRGREIFGGLWQGERSTWDVLDNYIRWVIEFRSLCVRHGLEGRAVEIATQAAPDVSAVEALKEAAAGVLVVLGKLYVAVAGLRIISPKQRLRRLPLVSRRPPRTSSGDHSGLPLRPPAKWWNGALPVICFRQR
jgi:hypothetical protein